MSLFKIILVKINLYLYNIKGGNKKTKNMKRKLKLYLWGFFNGFGCFFNFWEKPDFSRVENSKYKGKTAEEIATELTNDAWFKTCNDFKQACNQVANKYGYENVK